ncbi:MAG: cytochrome c [Phenylobacterium sp.]|uniref:c-type cytochrome n=1 Tax=Phenylobacterium sp. TaxID=1871053 RepID=UPI001B728080|nr:cytochrome c [Phenylobacterium sp.]MBP7816746.1 cytochrome c [Phenylobacterium sp.]
MKMISKLTLALALCLAAPAMADEPGPGGSKPPVPVTGQQVYQMVCQTCHMADGKGAVGAGSFPSLASNPKMKMAAYPIVMVTKGRGGMPWFSDMLTPEQTAAVITYVRTNFGNAYPEPVTADDVKRLSPPPAKPGH